MTLKPLHLEGLIILNESLDRWNNAKSFQNENCCKPTGQITGIDLGLKEFYTDAQGNTVENPRYLSKSERLFGNCYANN